MQAEDILRFRSCEIHMFESGLTVVKFPGCKDVFAWPEDTDDYRNRAKELGYGTDVFSMSREHDICHVMLAEAIGLPFSPVLKSVATEVEMDYVDSAREEAVVLALQSMCRWNGINIIEVARRYTCE